MSTSVVALVVAVVGVLGTLTSGLLAQRSAGKTKLVELQRAQHQSATEREEARQQARLEARRACYVLLNQAVRHHQAVLSKAIAGLPRQDLHEHIEEINSALKAQRDTYAQAQMVASDDVMEAAKHALDRLNRLAALVRQHADGRRSESVHDDAQSLDAEAQDALDALLRRMRSDLGVTGSQPEEL